MNNRELFHATMRRGNGDNLLHMSMVSISVGRNGLRIPGQSDHRFRSKVRGDSDPIRSPTCPPRADPDGIRSLNSGVEGSATRDNRQAKG